MSSYCSAGRSSDPHHRRRGYLSKNLPLPRLSSIISGWGMAHPLLSQGALHDRPRRTGDVRRFEMKKVSVAPNPVLGERTPNSFDGRGVEAPEVEFDSTRNLYRMWYVGRAFLA